MNKEELKIRFCVNNQSKRDARKKYRTSLVKYMQKKASEAEVSLWYGLYQYYQGCAETFYRIYHDM